MRAPALCSRRPEPVRNSQAHSLGRYRLFTTTGFESFLKLHVDDVPPSLKAGQGGMACPQSPGAAEHEGSHISHIRSTTRIHETARSGRFSSPLHFSEDHGTDSPPGRCAWVFTFRFRVSRQGPTPVARGDNPESSGQRLRTPGVAPPSRSVYSAGTAPASGGIRR